MDIFKPSGKKKDVQHFTGHIRPKKGKTPGNRTPPSTLPPSPPPSPFLSPPPKFIVQCIMYGLRVKTGIEEAHSQAHIPTQKQTYTAD